MTFDVRNLQQAIEAQMQGITDCSLQLSKQIPRPVRYIGEDVEGRPVVQINYRLNEIRRLLHNAGLWSLPRIRINWTIDREARRKRYLLFKEGNLVATVDHDLIYRYGVEYDEELGYQIVWSLMRDGLTIKEAAQAIEEMLDYEYGGD